MSISDIPGRLRESFDPRTDTDRSFRETLARKRLERAAGDTKAELLAYRKVIETAIARKTGVGTELDEKSRARAAIEETFLRVVSAAVTLIVGIFVFAQISSTMPQPDNSELSNATNTVESTTGDAFILGAVAVIVLVASLILALIGGFGRQGNGQARR